MSRAPLNYSARSFAQVDGFNPDAPIAGFYRMRLVSGGVFVGVRIWHGAPLDPETGEEMDRSHRWQASANGKPIDLERVWPRCAGEPINGNEYAYLTALGDWARDHAPASPFARPNQPVNLLTAPIDL